ncbi:MAG: acyltransferase [Alicyclobacillaceae bacterium]|nr:acyltransferase [Alicyclobacillaceae bacterium]
MPKKEHLYEVDLLRASIILGVICVHVISFYNLFAKPLSVTNVGYEAALSAFHFTREAFMFITGLVLFVTYYRRPFTAWQFWSKRFKLIFIPYAFWTLAYILFAGTYLRDFDWAPRHVLREYGLSLLTGNQFYLYYLLISMQLYLLFPVFVWLIRKLEGWHLWVFVASFALEIAFMWYNKAVLQHVQPGHLPGWEAALWKYRDRYVITYQFWFVAGALMAVHYQRVKSYFLERSRVIYFAAAAMLVALIAHFLVDRLVLGEDETLSVLVLQPVMVPYSLAVTALLWRLGVAWSAARQLPRRGWLARPVEIVASASFGVFLVHPVVMHFAEVAVYRTHPGAQLRQLLLPVSILAVYVVSVAIAYGIGKIPYVSYVVGQKKVLRRSDLAVAAGAGLAGDR